MKNTLASIAVLAFLAVAPAFAQAPAPAKPAAPAATAAPAAAPKPAAAALIDINTASADELDASLKGIGKVRAAAIVKGRPYKGKDELVQKNIIPQGVYDDIKDKIIAKQAK